MAYDYNKRKWEDELSEAQRKQREAEAAVNNYGQFNYSRQADYDAAWNKLNNREPFKYDLNKDALYKQYKDQYSALGKLAMQDTMGQASAMTGGYGNSYALTAGQQMYNQYMQKPNEMIPTLYGMARDRYDAEGNDLRNQFNLLAADRDYQYGLYNDAYSKALANRDYAGNQYNNIYNAAYEAARAQAADEQWEKSFNENKRQFDVQMARRSSGGGNRSTGEKSAVTPKMKTEALEAYNSGGERALDKYVEAQALSDDDLELIYEYVDKWNDRQRDWLSGLDRLTK
jgi:hypothetical protein